MEQHSNSQSGLLKVIRQFISLTFFLLSLVIILFIYIVFFTTSKISFKSNDTAVSKIIVPTTVAEVKEKFWTAPDISSVGDTKLLEQLAYGKKLIAHTSEYFGPNGIIIRSNSNGMNCQNCHLDAGTKVFGNNYSAVYANYPKYRARSGGIENIYKRVNDCFERSLNGKALDTTSKEMKAIVAYINFLGKDVPKGEKPKGSGFKDIQFLERAIDPKKGKIAYEQKCISCHQTNGEGVLNDEKTAFTYPPLWGKNSYNDGAGLYRMSNLAKYVKYNMPLGVSHTSTQLTDEEAWDIAAYVNSQPRPKKNITKDWPKIEEKPFDHPFGPYKDGFTEVQHKYGPFKPIKEKLEEMKKQKEKLTASIKNNTNGK